MTAASGSGDGSAIGAGDYGSRFGSLTVSGDLYVPQGELKVYDSNASGAEVIVTATGNIFGSATDVTQGASISGAGQIDNGGVIALDAALVTATVDTHNYLVTFDTQGGTDLADVRVFAPSFDAGFREIPAPPADAVWATEADGSGEFFTETTTLSGDTDLYAVSGFALLATKASNCTDGDALTVPGDLSGGLLAVNCDLILDLNGYALETLGVDISDGHTLTIDDTRGGGTLAALPAAASRIAGIHVPTTAALVLNNGSVTAKASEFAAGVGHDADDSGSAGAVTVNGGTLVATGAQYSAGIGGSGGRTGGTVTINGGEVIATGGGLAAGIGGGEVGHGGVLTVTGGNVTATGSSGSAGLGGGYRGSAGEVTITGGVVNATGGNSGPGIGNGMYYAFGDNGTITITGGNVTATAGAEYAGQVGAGIGGGARSSGAAV
ncbi:MAG: hypothetical protein WBV89_11350, partial [Ilumatobacter sp.]